MVMTGGWFIIVLPCFTHITAVPCTLCLRVIGCGPTGVEVAADLADFLSGDAKEAQLQICKSPESSSELAYEKHISIVAECHRPHISPTPVWMSLGCMVLANFVTPITHYHGVHRSTPLRSCIPSSWSTWTSSWSTQAAWQNENYKLQSWLNKNIYIYIYIHILIYSLYLIILYIHV